MNKRIYIIMVAAAMLLVPAAVMAQTTEKADSIATAVRLKALQTKKSEIEKQIQTEDAKRNKVVEGASAEALEAANIRQDSICLSLRSQLVDVELEIAEVAPNKVNARIVQQYNTIARPRKEEATKESER